jgi:hypothetical protein
VVVVHLNQSVFASNLVESFFRDTRNPTPMATPYQSGIPIDAIAPSTEDDNSLALKHCKEAYQSLTESIGWLSCSTRPDLAAVHSFLLSYNNKPLVGHMKAALYALHYIHSTHDYKISFTSEDIPPCIPPSTSLLPPTLRLMKMLSHQSQLTHPLSWHIVMLVWAPRLGALSRRVLFALSLSFAV